MASVPPDNGDRSASVARLAGRLLGEGSAPERWEPVGGGYTPALRLRVTFAGGRTFFAKAAVNDATAGWLRTEFGVYSALGSRDFLARVEGWGEQEDGLPLLVLEDLSVRGYWPPPWRPGDVEKVLAALEQVHACGHLAPPGVRSLEESRATLASWGRVAEDPEPFLSLRLCTRAWLERALPVLLEADMRAVLAGDDLCHMDTRSDNVCLTADGRGAVLVDWNWVSLGNGRMDLASWLSSLHAEGGPPPESVLPDAGELAALCAGYWAARAGQPPIPDAPRVRQVQRFQLSAALPWAARAVGLEEPRPDPTLTL